MSTGTTTAATSESGTGTRGRRLRLLLVAVGGIVLALGVFSIAAPRAADAALASLLAVVGYDWVLIGIVGLVALILVIAVLVAHGRRGIEQSTPPAPEDVFPVPRFGEDFDTFVEGSGGLAGVTGGRHEAVRERLREIAVTSVMRHENCTVGEARERVAAGDWTDDTEAAAFLSEYDTPGLGARLKAAVKGTSPYRRAAQVTAREIARLDQEAKR